MNRFPGRVLLAVGALVPFLGCEAGRQSDVTETDSAGVRIVVSTPRTLVYATVDPAPVLSLGSADAVGPTQFSQVQNIYVDPQGRLWVADGRSCEIRIFEPDGSHYRTLGGCGEGPGEFVRIRLLGASAGDTVYVADDANGRVTLFGPEGDVVRMAQSHVGNEPVARLFDVFPDGSVLGVVPRILAASEVRPGQVLHDSVGLIRMDLRSDTRQPYATAAGPLWVWTGRSQVPVPFTVNARFGLSGDDLHLVGGTAFRVRIYRAGRLLEAYGVDRPLRRVKGRDVAAYRRFVDAYVPEQQREDFLAVLDHEARPSVLPAYDRVLSTPEGITWAEIYDADPSVPRTWDVYAPQHAFAGQVETPADLTVMAVGRTLLFGVWRDGLGVEHVRTYAFGAR